MPTDEERAIYNELTRQEPTRAVAAPEKETDGKKTLTISEAMETSTDLTDMQYAMSKLFPEKVDQNSVMVGRIAPEVFLAMLHLVSVNEIMQSDPTQSIDVNKIYANNYVRLSIGLDGRGRIDTAELLGAAREEKRAMELMRGGGI